MSGTVTPSVEIERVSGDEGWTEAEVLDRICYPPETMATIIWRDVVWAHADRRVFARLDGRAVCHVGIYWRDGRDGDVPVRIGGIGGVMTLPEARRRGCATQAMLSAASEMGQAACDFGLLFCEPHNIAFYEGLGWQVFAGRVHCEQHNRRIVFDMMPAMFLPLRSAPREDVLDLCGLPW